MMRDIAKLVSNGHFKEALLLYSQLHSSSISPNKFTFPCLLKACSKLNSLTQGHILHTQLIKTGFYSDTYAATALLSMYMKFQQIKHAHQVFDEMAQPNEASVNAVISGFLEHGYFREGLMWFREVGLRRFRPNSVMIATVLSACDVVENGKQVHCCGVKIGVDQRDVYVGTGIVTMYMSCGDVISATKMFAMMEYKNVVSYNAIMSGLVQNGVNQVVLGLFKDMVDDSNERPNLVTLVSVLGACCNMGNLVYGRQIHGNAVKVGLQSDTMVGTALVNMYVKCGSSVSGYQVFKELTGKRSLITWNSIISGMLLSGNSDTALELFSDLESEGLVADSATWNTMIIGFSRLGKCTEAFQFFTKMISEGIAPTLKTLTSLLSACSVICSLQHGKEIHAHAIRACVSDDEFFATGLIDMYMKCGQSSRARMIFDQFDIKPADPALWNAMISGYGRNGDEESAFEIFSLMREQDVQPNSSTFVNVLSVCSHTGKVEKGLQLFEMISRVYGLTPTPQHLSCLIDLLGRSGDLKKAHELIQEIPEVSVSAFSSLLGAAGHHLDSELGENMAKNLSVLDPQNSTSYVILSNIYASAGRWKDVERIRNMLDVEGMEKHPGYSLEMT